MIVQTHDPTTGRDAPPAGWYADPWQVAPFRWWDGSRWSGYTSFPASGPPAGKNALPQARDDVRGGGVAFLGFAGAFALALVCQFVAVAGGASSRSLTVEIAGHAGLWSGLLLSAYVVTHRRAGGSLRDIGFSRPSGREIGLGIGIALAALFAASRVIQFLQALLPQDNDGIRSNLFVAHRPSLTAILVTAVLVCVGAPFFEELFFRGVVQSILTHRLGAAPALVVQAMLFGAAHYQIAMTARQAVVRIVAITVIGLFLGWLRRNTGRLGAGMVAHATNNAIVIGLTILLLYRR